MAFVMVASCGADASSSSAGNEDSAISDLERIEVAEATVALVLECMGDSGFATTTAEIVAENAPTRFDGEAYFLRLNGSSETRSVSGDFTAALTVAEDARRGIFSDQYSCQGIGDAAAAIRVLGPERAEMYLGSAGTPGSELARLMADPDVLEADAEWRACLGRLGIDSTSYEIVDDLALQIGEMQSYVSDTTPGVQGSDLYNSYLSRLPVLQRGSEVCDPPYAAVLKDRAAALAS